MKTIRILDLFCGEGLAARGYYQAFTEAGYSVHVTGVDIQPMRYPYQFVQEDALNYAAVNGWRYDFIHASPPCEGSSRMTKKRYRDNHEILIPHTRLLLELLGKPYVIENVTGARRMMKSPIMLCGTMFGLPLWRHRYFETNVLVSLVLLPCCDHSVVPVPVNNSSVRKMATKAEAMRAFGIADLDARLFTTDGLRKAIPPAYTHWLGKQAVAYLRAAQPASEPAFSFVQQLMEAA